MEPKSTTVLELLSPGICCVDDIETFFVSTSKDVGVIFEDEIHQPTSTIDEVETP